MADNSSLDGRIQGLFKQLEFNFTNMLTWHLKPNTEITKRKIVSELPGILSELDGIPKGTKDELISKLAGRLPELERFNAFQDYSEIASAVRSHHDNLVNLGHLTHCDGGICFSKTPTFIYCVDCYTRPIDSRTFDKTTLESQICTHCNSQGRWASACSVCRFQKIRGNCGNERWTRYDPAMITMKIYTTGRCCGVCRSQPSPCAVGGRVGKEVFDRQLLASRRMDDDGIYFVEDISSEMRSRFTGSARSVFRED